MQDGAGGPRARLAVPIVCGLAALGALLLLLLASERGSEPLREGAPAPPFTLLRSGDGPPVSLADTLGQVVLVNFWATWCGPCEAEMPAMQRLYDELQGEGFELLAVSVDKDPEAVAEFRERFGLSFPVLLDPDQEVATAYDTFKWPESILIDRRGRVIARFIGEREWDSPPYVERIRRELEKESSQG